jgi:hypothetical protein
VVSARKLRPSGAARGQGDVMTRIGEPSSARLVDLRQRFATMTGGEQARFVWIGNIECEAAWVRPGAVTLPRVSSREDAAIVRHLEELPLCLGGAQDVLVLREAPDPAYLAYLTELGLTPPEPLLVHTNDPVESISSALLRDRDAVERIRGFAADGAPWRMLPFGYTALEEELAREVIPVFGGAADVTARVNSKLFSRRLSRELALPTVPGAECESPVSLREGYEALTAGLPSAAAVVIKEALGVSGKGLLVLESRARFEQVAALLERRSRAGGDFAFVLEAWLPRAAEINYQFFVSADGTVDVLAIKESFTRRGVHLGHRTPARLTPDQRELCETAAQGVGRRLFDLGFRGVAGVDAIIDDRGVLYPVLELNARHNMSTYELRLDALVGHELKVVYRYYTLLAPRPVSFGEIHERLAPRLFRPGLRSGVGVHCFAPLNANTRADRRTPARGRLYAFLVGCDDDEVDRLSEWVYGALTRDGSPLRAVPGPFGEVGSC